jgi:FMN phosphatase YigB (HAD superfamily)
VAVEVVVFDVGETLIDETNAWQLAAETVGVPAFTVMGVLGGLAARGRHHSDVWDILGVPPPRAQFAAADFYPDALPCLERLRTLYWVGAVGNTGTEVEELLRPLVDFVGSSRGWGVEKPAAGFFERLAQEAKMEPAKIAYVGDRVDNDIVPALAAGMVAVHIRRGPWGHLHDPPEGALSIRSLDELPGVLA